MIRPGQTAPPLLARTVEGGPWRLSDQRPERFTLVVFHSGAGCAASGRLLQTLEGLLPGFRAAGVTVVAVSMDAEPEALAQCGDWDIADLPMGYGLTPEQARGWGLYFGDRGSAERSELFAEPAAFLIDRAGRLRFAALQSGPYAPIDLQALLDGLDAIEADARRGAADPSDADPGDASGRRAA